MKARPVLMSAPMVRALLAGTKTQTRRVVKGVFDHKIPALGRAMDCINDLDGMPSRLDIAPLNWELCPYGVPGDLLWVRETFASWWVTATGQRSHIMGYRADIDDPDWDGFGCDDPWWLDAKWEPSIHMPRAFSRLTLRIADVRVQRLREISEDDAKAEGCGPADVYPHQHQDAFAALWERINGAGSWAENPWVWALTFEVIKQNVDAVLASREAV